MTQPAPSPATDHEGGGRWVTVAAWVVVAALAGWTAARLAAIVLAGPGLPAWDAASHGFAGVEVARAIRAGNPIAFLNAINVQVTWPFVHSLLLAPAFLLFGDHFAVGDLASSVLFAGTVLAVFASGFALHPRRGAWIGGLAAVMVTLAPIYRFFGTVTMLEIPGAFLFACAIALHARCDREAAPRGLVIAAGISTTALFLCKYNYGLLWLLPAIAFEGGLLDHARRCALLARLRDAVRTGHLTRPFALFMSCYLAFMGWILLSGGTDFVVAGHRVSVRSPGNLAYGYLLLLCGWGWVSWRRAPAAARERWRALSERLRLLVLTIGVPLVVWFLIPYPNRVKEFFGFVINRSTGAPLGLIDRLLFYPRAFALEYAPHAVVGWVVLLLALVPPFRGGTKRRESSLLYFALVLGLLSEMVHHYQQSRFLFTTAVLIWLRASETAVTLVDRGMIRVARRAVVREVAWVAALAAILAWGWLDAPALASTRLERRGFQAPASFAAVAERVLRDGGRGRPGPWLLGCSNWLNPALLVWEAGTMRPGVQRSHVPVHLPNLPCDASEAAITARLRPVLTPGTRVVAALPERGSTLYARVDRDEVWADSVTAERLAANPGVITESDTLLSAAGFRVRTFRVVGAAGSR